MGEDVPRDVCKGKCWWWPRGPRWFHGWRVRIYGSRADLEGSHGECRWGGVGLSSRFPCVREESELVCRQLTCTAEGRGKDFMDAFHVDELVSALFV